MHCRRHQPLHLRSLLLLLELERLGTLHQMWQLQQQQGLLLPPALLQLQTGSAGQQRYCQLGSPQPALQLPLLLLQPPLLGQQCQQ